MNKNFYKKAGSLVVLFGIVAMIANLIQVLFFSFDELAADGVTYTKDYSPLIQGVIYLAITMILAYFIKRENKVAAIFAGVMAMVIGLSVFWLELFNDGKELQIALSDASQMGNGIDQFVIMYAYYLIVSIITITLCIMITGTTFKAVFGKR